MNTSIVDVTEENAQAVLIDESFKRPILVDFWADWCGPCKTLAPILVKLAHEYGGDFLLAKVDADALGPLASQFGVQSLPTMIVMIEGRPVDMLVGAQAETAIREMLRKHLPEPWQKDLAEAQALVQAGKLEEALTLLRQAYKDSNEAITINFALTSILIELKRYEEAEKLLGAVRLKDQNDDYEQLKARLDLARSAEKAPEITSLEQQLQQSPDDLELVIQLAAKYTQNQHQKDALELLFKVMQKDINAKDGEIKKEFLEILAVLGASDPLTKSYRGRLYSLLY